MKSQVNERRSLMVSIFTKTWSLKSAVEVVSERFNVREATLRIDWSRRHKWPKKVFEDVSDPVLCEFYHLGIHYALRQIELELVKSTNPSCRVGLLRAKAEILFKLLDVQNSIADREVLVKRVESLEEKLGGFLSQMGKIVK